MADEKRLIYADSLITGLNRVMIRGRNAGKTMAIAEHIVKMVIAEASTVDAVEVVRCKDCAFWTYEGVGSSTLKRFGSCEKWYPFGNEQHSCHDDDFCSNGERRAEDGNKQ